MCLNRAEGLKKRLVKNLVVAENIQKLMADYLEKGYIVRTASKPISKRHWYLPIFPVFNPQKPEKTRVVWDAAARGHTGECLNSFLLSGPDLLVPLPEVLMRFREREIACTADIGEMFHRVYVRPEDRDCQRFLWIPMNQDKPEEFAMQVCTFGASCSPTTAQYVKNHNADRFVSKYPVAADAIKTRFYVDDYLNSFDDVETARQINRQILEINLAAGMELKKWRSNRVEVIPNDCTLAHDSKTFKGDGKVLGLNWNSERDDLQFSVDNTLLIQYKKVLTKREILRAVMSLFDPLGLVAHVVMPAKIILRVIWRTGCGWDEKLEEPIVLRWREWCGRVELIRNLQVPRWHRISATSRRQLHVFVDAGENGFAAVAYFRGYDDGDRVVVSIVMGKSKVSPLRAVSIPRLELMAAVLGARLADTICRTCSVQIHERIFWTDSKDVLFWITSPSRRYRQFVALRINEVLEKTAEAEWRYVPTEDNVADDATKLKALAPDGQADRWLTGPAFLHKESGDWPVTSLIRSSAPEEELKQLFVIKQLDLGAVPDADRFSKWTRLRNTTVYVLRVVLATNRKGIAVTPDEVQRAEEELFRAAQQSEFSDVVSQLSRDPHEELNKGHLLYQLTPHLDDGRLLRVTGRLNKDFPLDVRAPIILPRGHRITKLLIQHYHEQYNHVNTETVVNELRQKFYVAHLRQAVKESVRDCMFCRVHYAKPVVPRMGNLPPARTALRSLLFSRTGMDYFGPVEVSVGRRKEKRWVCLFTCLTVRAIHIEIVSSLDMNSCMMCVQMFVKRRGTPVEMWSDNATCFKATAKEWERMQGTFPMVKFNFIPPGAPNFGGCWERMIRTVKSNINRMLQGRSLTDEILRCTLVEAEWIVNSHPLTHVPVALDNPEALTPNHLIHGSSNGEKYNGPPIPEAFVGQFIRKSYRNAQQMVDHFWKRFQLEVIPILNIRTQWHARAEPMKVGDLVQVADDNRRGCWRLGRVIEAIASRDGQVRQAKVQTSTGLIHRPTSKMAKLDIE